MAVRRPLFHFSLFLQAKAVAPWAFHRPCPSTLPRGHLTCVFSRGDVGFCPLPWQLGDRCCPAAFNLIIPVPLRQDPTRDQDPRAEILKFANKAEDEPFFVAKAYQECVAERGLWLCPPDMAPVRRDLISFAVFFAEHSHSPSTTCRRSPKKRRIRSVTCPLGRAPPRPPPPCVPTHRVVLSIYHFHPTRCPGPKETKV